MMNRTEVAASPFILLFAEPIPSRPEVAFRYDVLRQVGEILRSGEWVDAADAKGSIQGSDKTLITEVKKETTDDE
jgi:hypothetical protein